MLLAPMNHVVGDWPWSLVALASGKMAPPNQSTLSIQFAYFYFYISQENAMQWRQFFRLFSILRRWHIFLFSACSPAPVSALLLLCITSFAYPIIMQMSLTLLRQAGRLKLEKWAVENSDPAEPISDRRLVTTSLIIRSVTSRPRQQPISGRGGSNR